MRLHLASYFSVIAALFITVLLLHGGSSSQVHAEDGPPRIISLDIPGLINADGSGSYIRLLQRAWEIDNLSVKVLPTKRALRDFSNASEATCFIPLARKLAEELGVDTYNKVFSNPFNTSYSAFISQQGSTPPLSLREIEGKIIGAQRGFPIVDEVVSAAALVTKTNSLESLLRMLEKGRIAFAYVHFPDMELMYFKNGMSRLPESEMRFHIVPDILACTKDAADWVHHLDEFVDHLYANDTIRDILGASYTGR